MENMTEEDIRFALRHRVQSQALCHLVGQSVSARTIFRFRKAGTWDGDIAQKSPHLIGEVLRNRNHQQRMELPDGPLIVVQDGNERGIIEVAEHLLTHEVTTREIALQHFLDGATRQRRWVSPFIQNALEAGRDELLSPEESVWLGAGLRLCDAIDHDFYINVAGLRQASKLQFEESYQQYLRRVLRPHARSFDHDRPPIWDPHAEAEQIRRQITEWSKLHNLADALDLYLWTCGYLPLSGELSAGALIDGWNQSHPNANLWATVWKWSDESSTPIAQYHAAIAFLEHPEWIVVEHMGQLLQTIRDIVTATDSENISPTAPLWQLRSTLHQHYQYHLEAFAPGLNGAVLAASACWLAETVAVLFGSDPDHVAKGCEFLDEQEVLLSSQRWAIARTRVTTASIRNATLFSPSLWADSLLATAIRQWKSLPTCEAHRNLRDILIDKMCSALCLGRLQTAPSTQLHYALDQIVTAADLDVPIGPTEIQAEEAARQLLAGRSRIDASDGLQQALQDLRNASDTIAIFCCLNIRSLIFSGNGSHAVVKDYLSDNAWRHEVFHGLALGPLDALIFFLVEWQLRQKDDWLVRLPQIFAYECEQAEEAERQRVLLWATIFSALACDVASPVARLATGAMRPKIIEILKQWCNRAQEISRESEPWVAARVRGLLGSLDEVV